MKRIWDGNTGRSLRFWETFFWSVLAVVLGLKAFGWIDWFVLKIMAWASYAVILVLTPLVVGFWVFHLQRFFGLADESLKHVPISPAWILLPRMAAIFLTWFRIFLPLLILLFVTGMAPSMGDYREPFGIITRFSVTFLAIFGNFEMYDGFMWESVPRFILIDLCALCYLVGGVTAPIAWGFCMATCFRISPIGYFISFMFYYLFPVAIIWGAKSVYNPFRMFSTDLYPEVYLIIIMQGLSFAAITCLCIRVTCFLMGRRL